MKKLLLFFILLLFHFSVLPQTEGPWNHKVYRATSADGLNRIRYTSLLFYPASVPGAVIDTNLGNIVFEKTLNSKQVTLNLNLSDGIYFLQVKSSNFVQTEILEVIK